tara:strand:- start:341 stop:646 length:306 start_codon:yes stop_codon:yes gene_type:complete
MEALKNLFVFNKKLTRSDFIVTWIGLVFGSVIFVALAAALPENLMGLAMFATIGAYVWALLAMYIGRLNDMGWSAWCVVGILVPVVNLIVFGAMLFTPSKK